MAEKRYSSTALSWWRKMIFIFPIAVLWAIPISRAVSFLKYTKNILSEEQTLNAQNDVRYGIALLIVYLICLVADLVLCLLFARKNFGLLLLLLSVPIWVVMQIIRYHPEEVIVLVPSINLLRVLMLNLIPLFIGLGLVGIWKLKFNSLGNARTN
jgi:hypothetical protein